MIPELTLQANGPTSINASWTAVSGATLYLIFRGTTETGPFTLVGTTSNLSYIDTGLNSNTTYYYRVIPFLTTVWVYALICSSVYADITFSIKSM